VYVLIVDIQVKAGQEQEVEKTYRGPFRAAISAQPGFVSAEFLRPNEGCGHVLVLAFEGRPAQQAWVATDLHTKVWNEMQASFDSYSVRNFTAI
jgi:heme-degrading monooxygenase HmoA